MPKPQTLLLPQYTFGALLFGLLFAPNSSRHYLVANIIKIVKQGTLQELGTDQIGEICISGPSVMLGYYKNPKETSKVIIPDKNGVRWVRTGDLGYITKEGLLFHIGRIRRIYMTAHDGQPAKIFPMLVEDVINHSAAVSECSVVGRKRKNSDYYETVAFIIKKDESYTDEQLEKELISICKEMLPTYMESVEYIFTEKLPHTLVGKVDFRKLEEHAQEAQCLSTAHTKKH